MIQPTAIGVLASGGDVQRMDSALRAAKHLIEPGIDRLVVLSGDSNLSGADLFRHGRGCYPNWSSAAA